MSETETEGVVDHIECPYCGSKNYSNTVLIVMKLSELRCGACKMPLK